MYTRTYATKDSRRQDRIGGILLSGQKPWKFEDYESESNLFVVVLYYYVTMFLHSLWRFMYN